MIAMREIKFRGRDDLTGNGWVYGDFSHGYYGNECLVDEILVVEKTVGQFTGLRDSDGREIYEGDMLEFAVFDYQGIDVQYRGFVEWCDSRFIVSVCLVLAPKTWRKKRDYEESYYDLDWLLAQDDEAKIIGNVHDNPELLEQKP